VRATKTVLVLFVLLASAWLIFPAKPAKSDSQSSPTNIILNSSFENGLDANGIPNNWTFQTCEGVANATAAVDTSTHTGGADSAKVNTGPLTATGCFPGNYSGRTVGFSQFRHSVLGSGQGYNFTQLADDPSGFSFWFRLQSANDNGMAGFEVRLFGAEALAELDYIFNPDTSIGVFQNNTNTHSLLFYGYQPGQWYHFNRNLKADWLMPMGSANTPLNLHYNFTLIQFQGFASRSGSISRSEILWLDDVRAYVGSGPIPVSTNNNPMLEVWSPDVHSSNITDPRPLPIPSIFAPGRHITVLLNLTGGGPIAAFDISLNYNISSGPNVLQLLSATAAGGIFDPSTPPSGCVIRNLPGTPKLDFPPGEVRLGEFIQGPCSVDGTNGTLFTMIFNITGIGSGSIDIVQGNGNGSTGSVIESEQGGVVSDLSFTAQSAYFKNAPGIPPVASFTFDPDQPVVGQTVSFDGTSSFDPEAPRTPNHGTRTEAVIYDSNNNKQYDAGDILVLGPAPALGTTLSSDLSILYNDQNSNGHYDSGEAVVDDTSGKIGYQSPDVVIAGTRPNIGQVLKSDPKLLYVDTHANSLWDDGFVWSFGDGSSELTGNVTSHIFLFSGTIPSAGIFPVKLTVYDADDNLAMRAVNLVNVVPEAVHDVHVFLTVNPRVFVGDNLTVGVFLTNRGNRAETISVNTTFDANGNTTIGVEPNVVLAPGGQKSFQYIVGTSFLTPRTYTVTSLITLLNTTSGGVIPNSDPACFSPTSCIARVSFILQSPGLRPVANFTIAPASPVVGSTVQFDGSSSFDPDGFVVGWAWSFGDGSSSLSSFTYHVYNSPGTYTVTLTVQDNTGVQASTSKIIVVRPQPTHDVGIVYVYPDQIRAISSQTININVGLINNGVGPETVDLTAYYGTNVAGSLTEVRIGSGSYPIRFNVQWDTQGVPAGNYTISATVFLASDEYPSDNSLADGVVTLLPPPSLTDSPSSGPPGTQVQIQGSGFPSSSYGPFQVLVTFDDQLVGFATSYDGRFSFTFNVPLAQTGAHTIKALDSSGAKAQIIFQVTQATAPSRIQVGIATGTIYFPGDTVVVNVQTSLDGRPVLVSTLLIILVRPSGSNLTLIPVSVSPGVWKATFAVPSTGSIGTYAVVVKAHQVGSLDGTELSGFEVKPTWLQGHASQIAGVAVVIGGLGVLGFAWRRGFLTRKRDEGPGF